MTLVVEPSAGQLPSLLQKLLFSETQFVGPLSSHQAPYVVPSEHRTQYVAVLLSAFVSGTDSGHSSGQQNSDQLFVLKLKMPSDRRLSLQSDLQT